MYAVRKIKEGSYEIANFSNCSVEPKSVYTVSNSRQNNLECDCIGWYRQKDKLAHEHCIVVRKFMENPVPQFIEVNDNAVSVYLF